MGCGVWSVMVFRCDSGRFRDVIVDFYGFVSELEDVESCHFLVRDRIGGKVVCSFRVRFTEGKRKVLTSKIVFKLKDLIAEDEFAVDPQPDHSLHKFVAFPWRETAKERGAEKFETFCGFLSRMSKMVIDMAKMNYFDSGGRVEIAHLMSWMLGCTEFGLLSPKEMQVGYYDRIDDKNIVYLKQAFSDN